MAIKPKSRAHEDRIRALEAAVENLSGYVARHMDNYPQARRPWYKRIFGL